MPIDGRVPVCAIRLHGRKQNVLLSYPPSSPQTVLSSRGGPPNTRTPCIVSELAPRPAGGASPALSAVSPMNALLPFASPRPSAPATPRRSPHRASRSAPRCRPTQSPAASRRWDKRARRRRGWRGQTPGGSRASAAATPSPIAAAT
eukprot:365073-Chlamydomonas_euryale.AAC.2